MIALLPIWFTLTPHLYSRMRMDGSVSPLRIFQLDRNTTAFSIQLLFHRQPIYAVSNIDTCSLIRLGCNSFTCDTIPASITVSANQSAGSGMRNTSEHTVALISSL